MLQREIVFHVMANLRDVAERAGVSVATASRVASGSARVRPHTRELVEQAMRDLLYIAPGRGPSTGAIGLLVPELQNPVFPALAQALELNATRYDLATILCNTGGSPNREADYVHMLLDRRVDGMIFISSEVTDLRSDHGHYERLLAEGAKLVFVNGSSPALHVTSVGVDERAAGRLAAEHLLSLGHALVGFVAGPEFTLPTREKRAGYEAALLEAGLEPEEQLVVHAAFTVAAGREAAHDLLDRSSAAHGRDLLERPCRDRRPPGGGRTRPPRPRGALDRRVRRHRGRVDAAAPDNDRAADRADRGDRARGSPWPDRQPDVELPSFVFRPRLRLGGTSAPPP